MGFNGHYDVVGEGEPVLCIPGFASGNWVFSRLLEPLVDRFRFILPDNRGMGRSPASTQGYCLEDLAADALNLMNDLGYERFRVIGLSMGGFIAQLLALEAPERVSSLVLMCSTSGGPEYRQSFPSLTEEQVRAIYALDPLERVQAALGEALCPVLQSHYPDVYQYVVEKRVADPADPEQVMQQFFAVQRFMDQPLPLLRITCPVLVLTADQDRLVPRANAERLLRDLPNARLVELTGVDHLFFLEKGDETTAAISHFFAEAG